MKNNSVILTAIIVFAHISCLSAQNFFPLNLGNKYQYKVNASSSGPGGGTQYWTYYGKFSMNQDSIINGKRFTKLDFDHTTFLEPPYHLNDIFFNYDSTEQKIFVKIQDDDTIRLAAEFNLPVDSSIISYISGTARKFISDGIMVDTLFGIPVQVFQMRHDSVNSIYRDNYTFRFAENFGLLYYFFFRAWGSVSGSSGHNLISAMIDSSVYNPLTLEITSLSPLVNRPIDTFPFVLNGGYLASIPNLVDSFYVSIIHTRADTIVNSWLLEFENGMVNVPIYSASLQVGDKIKFRAKATDESIFENVAYYPDTGYAIINVLPPVTGLEDKNVYYSFSLQQNYPNPFNPFTIISYEIAENQKIELEIFDVLGNKVATLVDEEKSPGRYEIEFDGTLLSSGVYFYKLIAGEFTQTRKMILSK